MELSHLFYNSELSTLSLTIATSQTAKLVIEVFQNYFYYRICVWELVILKSWGQIQRFLVESST